MLAHHATIERRSTRVDRTGQPRDLWEEKAHDVPCRLGLARGGEVFTDRSRDVVRADYTLYLPAGTDIGEADRVSRVWDAGGATLAEDLEILLVRPVAGMDGKTHHIECPCALTREAS